MKWQLNSPIFNDEKIDVTDDTVHNEILSESDGFEDVHSQSIYKDVIRWTIRRNGNEDKKWPPDWINMSVRDLASKLVILLLMILPYLSSSAQLNVQLGLAKTDLKQNAITIALSYIKDLDSIWNGKDFFYAGPKSLFAVTPQIDITTGNEDAFSAIDLKLTGMFMTFRTTTVGGVVTPDTRSRFNVFPVSAGVETNNLFNNINGVVEAGWVPWNLIKYTKMGVFLQAGYKFHVDSTKAQGGDLDESLEQPRSLILRAKGSLQVSPGAMLKVSAINVGVFGRAVAWEDIANGAFYYLIDGRLRFFLTPSNYFDLIYQKGSGAPLFNDGSQYGMGVTLKL